MRVAPGVRSKSVNLDSAEVRGRVGTTVCGCSDASEVQNPSRKPMSSIGVPEERLQTIIDRTKDNSERDLYPWQREAIINILTGKKDTIVIAGTSHGKSLVFQSLQFAAPKATVLVVSPLVALMENQVNVPLDSG